MPLPLIDDLRAYLRASRPSPNAARPDVLVAPVLVWNDVGRIQWHETLKPFAELVVAQGAPEVAQGFARLVAEVAAAVGGEVEAEIEPIVAALARGDRHHVARADHLFDLGEDRFRNHWRDIVTARRPRPRYDALNPTPIEENPLGEGRVPGFELYLAVRKALAVAAGRYEGRPSKGWRVQYDAQDAIVSLLSVLMDHRPELGAAELIALVHLRLDPSARQAAPGGLWVETSRRGPRVRLTYGRDGARLLQAEFEGDDFHSTLSPSYFGARIEKFAAAPRAKPAEADYRAALVDLARRGVLRVWASDVKDPGALAALRWGGFEEVERGMLQVSGDAARALALGAPLGT